MQLSQQAVNILDYVVIGISGCVFLVSLIGAGAVVLLSRSPSCADSSEFNKLWRARVCMQLLGALYALSQLLRLQILWGPNSILVGGGYEASAFCRAFTACAFGLCEPLFLLLALFSCVFSLQGPRSFTEHLNTSIVLFAAVLSMPACAGQIICSLFTYIFPEPLDYTEYLWRILFVTFDTRQTSYCTIIETAVPPAAPLNPARAPAEQPPLLSPPLGGVHVSSTSQEVWMSAYDLTSPPPPPPVESVYGNNCAFCTFALLSTLISATLGSCMLLGLLFVTHKVMMATINRTLMRRMRLLQIFSSIFILGSLICRGVTVIFQPFSIDFEILRVTSVVCIAGTILTLSSILVYQPLWDSLSADRMMYKQLQQCDEASFTVNPLLSVTRSVRSRPHSERSHVGSVTLQPSSPLVKNEV